ncbi:hypothetical protein LJ707_01730 [Mucilaginibacter sp. UR6-1]|uniref:hypothetical protein n=1 Tax=Mucilaginibacter sp. UR6-1 TaxID=1435643 RepID=UPI001E5E74B0|nr:hypothetical protein [Mucilaginibacter sp. UR6-1]MCC8407632.1 hypothetical protein [Mucilaginibacter sp. UR6-1]
MTTENNDQNTDPKEANPGENTGGNELAKGNQPNEQKKLDDERVHTVTPDNDSGDPGPPIEERDTQKHDE